MGTQAGGNRQPSIYLTFDCPYVALAAHAHGDGTHGAMVDCRAGSGRGSRVQTYRAAQIAVRSSSPRTCSSAGRHACRLITAAGGLLFLVFRGRRSTPGLRRESDAAHERGKSRRVIRVHRHTPPRSVAPGVPGGDRRGGLVRLRNDAQACPKTRTWTRFGSMDHHYLQHYLKYGYLGLITFIAFAVSA